MKLILLKILATLFELSTLLPLSALGMTKASWVFTFIGMALVLWMVWV